MASATYQVTGMTCEHCVHAVTEELRNLDGVSDVTVDLVPGGQSAVTVTSDAPLAEQAVAAALDEAGDYQLAGASRRQEPAVNQRPFGLMIFSERTRCTHQRRKRVMRVSAGTGVSPAGAARPAAWSWRSAG